MTVKEVEVWAFKIFNYLNGFVNPSYRVSSLKINRYASYYAQYTHGSISSSNYISINPRLIEETFKSEYIPTVLADILIHELTHAQQRLDWKLYREDKEYNNKIEKDAVSKSYQFTNRNKSKIEEDLHITILEGPLPLDYIKDDIVDEIIKDIT